MTRLRTDTFAPLTAAPAAGERREFHVTVIPQTEQNRPFQSLAQHATGAPETGSPGRKKICEPRVSVQRDGDRVSHIRVECTCGQVMDVACVYDEPPKEP